MKTMIHKRIALLLSSLPYILLIFFYTQKNNLHS